MRDLVNSDAEEDEPAIMVRKTEEAKRTAEHATEFEEYMASASASTQPARAASASTRKGTSTTTTTSKTTATTVATTTATPTSGSGDSRGYGGAQGHGTRSLLDEMSEINDQQLRLAEVVLPNGEVHVAQAEVPRYVTIQQAGRSIRGRGRREDRQPRRGVVEPGHNGLERSWTRCASEFPDR